MIIAAYFFLGVFLLLVGFLVLMGIAWIHDRVRARAWRKTVAAQNFSLGFANARTGDKHRAGSSRQR